MIWVTASIIVLARDQSDAISWESILSGKSLLQRAVDTARATDELDDIFILTDFKAVLASQEALGVEIKQLPPWLFNHRIDLISKQGWHVNQELLALSEMDALGDIHFFLNWRMPLLTTRSLGKMYQTLLEDRIAARVVGIYPVDPNLFMRLAGKDSYFPVWADVGSDRQDVPQLYRAGAVGVVHTHRQSESIPESKGFCLSREQGLEILEVEDLDLAAFYLKKRGEAP